MAPAMRASLLAGGATSMNNELEVKILNWRPNGGKPTPIRQMHVCRKADARQQAASYTGLHREGMCDGSHRWNIIEAKAKGREALKRVGSSPPSEVSRSPLGTQAYGPHGGVRARYSYLVRSAGFRAGGRPKERKNLGP